MIAGASSLNFTEMVESLVQPDSALRNSPTGTSHCYSSSLPQTASVGKPSRWPILLVLVMSQRCLDASREETGHVLGSSSLYR